VQETASRRTSQVSKKSDQTEFQRKLEEKVTEMVAPTVENSSSETSSKTLFLASNILERYMGCEEDDRTICDSCSRVCSVYFLYMMC